MPNIYSIRSHYPLPPRDSEAIYQYATATTFLKVSQTVTIAPEPTRRIINAIGIIKHNEKIYLPVVAAERFDERGGLIP
jgi:hypothetical protein